MVDEFNQSHCDERHLALKDICEKLNMRLDKVENRFLIMITTLTLNLVGVISLLIIQFIRFTG